MNRPDSRTASGTHPSAIEPEDQPRRAQVAVAAIAPAVLAYVLVVATLDPATSWPGWPAGPGITLDESFNIQQGFRLVVGSGALLEGSLTLREVFGDANDLPPGGSPLGAHLADHPPLGRWWIGLAHQCAVAAHPHLDFVGPVSVAGGRYASAQAFGLLVLLVGWQAARWYGTLAGAAAGLSLILMPRLFAHAHLAALETILCLLWTAAVLAVARGWRGLPAGNQSPTRNHAPTPPAQPASRRAVLLTGLLFGLLLLTKIHGVLLTVPVGLWALWHWRWQAVVPLVLWGLIGLVVFFVGWPWLWLDPAGHFVEYFGRTTERVPLNVWYFGEKLVDRDVPFHYPWVMFVLTMPVGLLLLGGCGLFRPARREQLLLGAWAFPLVVFSVPGIAVYDGVRLFLIVFPLWGLLVGRGTALVLGWLQQRIPRRAAAGCVLAVLALQATGSVQLHPYQLSYYSLAAGGPRGAAALGMEATYWQDSIAREMIDELLEQVSPGEQVAVTPVLHPFQLVDLTWQNPRFGRGGREFVAWTGDLDGYPPEARPAYLLAFHRLADLAPALHTGGPPGAELVYEVQRAGVRLAALYRFPKSTGPPPAD